MKLSLRRREATAPRMHRVWLLTILVAAVTIAVGWRLRADAPLFEAPVRLPWWALMIGFYLGERTVVHYRFNRHAYSFSLSEIPLVMGLFLVSPLTLLTAQAVGSVLALTTHRRQPLVKAAFNLAQFGLQSAVAVVGFRALANVDDPLGLASAGAALVAALAAWYLANLLISAAIRLSGGTVTRREMTDVLLAGVGAASMNVGLGIASLNMLWLRPQNAWVAVLPVAVLYASYRAYMVQRHEHGKLSAIYEATRELHRIPQLEDAMAAVVRRARTVFEAEYAAIHLFPEGPHRTVFTTRMDADGMAQMMEPDDNGITDPLLLIALAEPRSFIGSTGPRPDIITAPLFEQDTVIGLFVVRHPIGDVGEFSKSDLTILETMAAQLAVSLENGRLEDSLAQLTRLKEELRHQALHDPLTGLANRVLLRDRLDEVTRRREPAAALIFLDLDHFKTVNDTYGHQAGDRLLNEVAARLTRSCREHDIAARVGGDEFAVLLTRLHSPDDVETVAKRIMEAVSAPVELGSASTFCGASLGITHVVAGDHTDDVLRRADQAMYTAKHRGRGSFQVFGESMEEEVQRAIRLRIDLQEALLGPGVGLDYQPIVSLVDRRMVGAEALLRWHHPELGLISPAETLSVAAEASVLDLLAAWTIDRACKDLATLRLVDPSMFVSVNVSPDQLTDGLVETIRTALVTHGVPAHNLIVEITETTAVQGSADAIEHLAGLGVRIAIDDFGTGYSSLSRLDTLPIDVVKIDRSFIDRMIGPGASPLARMVLEIGNTLELTTVAEGIESEDQLEQLLAQGCGYGQGFLFAPAIPLDELVGLVRPSLTIVDTAAILHRR